MLVGREVENTSRYKATPRTPNWDCTQNALLILSAKITDT